MKVLIVHYHLKPGGVTSVIRRQLSVLASLKIEAAVLVGEAPSSGADFPFVVEPALAYDSPGVPGAPTPVSPERVAAIADAVRRAAGSMGGGEVVVHVHNPTIRKNAALLGALAELADSGTRLLLQVHDLAEDWRPDVYSPSPYPDGAHWAALNGFDVAALENAGAGRVSLLPNSVSVPAEPRAGGRRGSRVQRGRGPGLVLYPVRGIRRKNLGEAVLLSLFARPGASVGVTLPPTTAKDLPFYDSWRAVAAELEAPIAFGIGLERTLDEAYAEAGAVLTTSVKEGFGLSYLEAAARSRATLGRRLSRVVSDFEASGVSFPALYERIAVPSALFDEDGFLRRVRAVVERAASLFGRAERGAELGRAVAESVLGASAAGPDFGRLDEEAQREVLRSLASERRARAQFIAANPFIDGWDEEADRLEPPSPERLAPWSEAAYGERLAASYGAALAGEGSPSPAKDRLLDRYLLPEYFHGVGI